VGVCTAGKSTLRATLQARGYSVRHIAQEHSFVQDMWQKIAKPDLLIFLDVSYEVSTERRRLNWTKAEYDEQQRRLAHARQHADFYLQTDPLAPEEVAAQVLTFLGGMFNQAG
jgi:thymidylate kinase